MERKKSLQREPLNSRSKAGNAKPSTDGIKHHPKQPVSKVPHDLREKLCRSLPRYSGVYSVGIMEMEIPVEEPRTFSNITRHKRHILELETVLFNVYYPSAFGSGSGRDPSGLKKWSRATWMPRPRRKMAKGYSRFSGIPPAILEPYLLATVGFTKTRAFRNAHLADHWPPPQNAYAAGYDVKNKAGHPPEGEPDAPVFPVLVFSHGLGGERTTYSSVCGEFASYGFVVVAIEHRDGSGVRTFVNHPSEKWREDNAVDHRPEEFHAPYDKVDYIWPQENPRDTAPHSEKGVDQELREAQIRMRKAEIKEVEKVLKAIHDGNGEQIAEKNLRKKGMIGSSSRGLMGVDWTRWKGRFHLDQVTMLGHSFGAATAVAVLRDREMFPNMGQGIIYDIWGGPVIFEEAHKIKCPLLGINSEAFMYWEQNFKTASGVALEAESQGMLSWLLTVRGTVHISQSDFHILFPKICRVLLGATANPQRAIGLNINASLEFLRLVMPRKFSQMNRGSDEGILRLPTLQKMPTEHRPSNKWIGMRLAAKAPADLTRGLTRGMRKRGDRMGTGNIEEEVWMHSAPTKELLEKFGLEGKVAAQDARDKPTLSELIGKDGKQYSAQTSARPGDGNGDDDEDKREQTETMQGTRQRETREEHRKVDAKEEHEQTETRQHDKIVGDFGESLSLKVTSHTGPHEGVDQGNGHAR